MGYIKKSIDPDIQEYFTNFFKTHFNIESEFQVINPKYSSLFILPIDGKFEEFHISYTEDFSNVYSLQFKTTAETSFFLKVLNILFDTDTIDYDARFKRIFQGIEDTNSKFKIFKTTNLLTSELFNIKTSLEKSTGKSYSKLVATRHIRLAVNSILYDNKMSSHYLNSRVYFKFRNCRLDSTCYLYSQSIHNKEIERLTLWIADTTNILNFETEEKNFQIKLKEFAHHELFSYITKEIGIPIEQLMLMSEEELKPYADLISMVKL